MRILAASLAIGLWPASAAAHMSYGVRISQSDKSVVEGYIQWNPRSYGELLDSFGHSDPKLAEFIKKQGWEGEPMPDDRVVFRRWVSMVDLLDDKGLLASLGFKRFAVYQDLHQIRFPRLYAAIDSETAEVDVGRIASIEADPRLPLWVEVAGMILTKEDVERFSKPPRYTIGMERDGGGVSRFLVYGTSVSASDLLAHYFLTYNRPVSLNGVGLSDSDAESALRAGVDDDVFKEALPFLKDSGAYAEETSLCQVSASQMYQRSHDARGADKTRAEALLAAKNRECRGLRDKHFSHYRQIGSEEQLKALGVFKEAYSLTDE